MEMIVIITMLLSKFFTRSFTTLKKCFFFFVSQVSKRGHICRISKDECDFTEFCNGNSEYCSQDVTSLDFEPCHNKTAFCYKGICRDPDLQCAELFGKCNSCIFFSGVHF